MSAKLLILSFLMASVFIRCEGPTMCSGPNMSEQLIDSLMSDSQTQFTNWGRVYETIHPIFMRTVFTDNNQVLKKCECFTSNGAPTEILNEIQTCKTYLTHRVFHDNDRIDRVLLATYYKTDETWTRINYNLDGSILSKAVIVPSDNPQLEIDSIAEENLLSGELDLRIAKYYQMVEL